MSAPVAPAPAPAPRVSLRIAAAVIGLLPIVAVIAGAPSSRSAVVAVALAIALALHGYGRVVAWVAKDEDAPLALVLTWGLAVFLGLAGVMLALHIFGPATRVGIVAVGCVLGARWLAHAAPAIVDAFRAHATATSVIAWTAAGVVIVFAVLAAAGHWHGPFIDGETGYLGQLRRLDDTGALADPIGFPRAAGLGGQVALAALASPLDLRAAHLVDRGLLFGLVVLLGVVAVRRRAGAATLTAVVLPLMLLAVPELPDDMAPHWSIVAFMLAAALSLDRARELGTRGPALATVLVVVAAVTLRHALVPFAFVMLAVVIRSRRALWKPAVVIAGVVIAPFVLAVIRARLGTPTEGAFSADVAGTALGRSAMWAIGGGVTAIIVGLALPKSVGAIRTTALAACASLACAGLLSPSATAAWQFGFPLAIAIIVLVGLAVVGEPADEPSGDRVTRRPPFASAVILASLIVGVLPMARFAAGRPQLGYQLRAAKMLDDARAIGDLPRAEATRLAADYDAAQRTIPAGARVGIWVDRADLVRYDTHAVFDLRTPSARACIAAGPMRRPRACHRLERAAARLDLEYLMVADPALPPVDPLAALARLVPAGSVVFERGGVTVIASVRQ